MRKLKYIFSLITFLLTFSCRESAIKNPILILSDFNDFGSYTQEILKTEGFNLFSVDSLSGKSITPREISRYGVVVLTRPKLTLTQCEIINRYVSDGGILISFMPGAGLYDVFGISGKSGEITDAYVAIDTSNTVGKGLTPESLQLHGTADEYSLSTGKMIAGLVDRTGNQTHYPALVKNSFGKGTAYAFSYNLPEVVVLTRQGNPLLAGQETDGINGLRAMDLFTGGWVDTAKNRINQADMHMSLLSHCIESAGDFTQSLPRLWYFPDNLNCVVTLTNDGEYRSEADFETQFSDIDSLGAKMTLYVMQTDKVSGEWVQKWTNKGFEISGHPDDTGEAPDPKWSDMTTELSAKNREIYRLTGYPMRTVVNHWFVWCGKDSSGTPEFAAQPMIEERQGIGMDINYAHYDNGSGSGHFLGTSGYGQGNYTGSGLVMKFADSRDLVLNIYQHLNNVYDQQYMELKDPEGFFQCFKGIMDRSLGNEVYSFISIKSHNDEYFFSKEPLRRMILYSTQHGIPVWTASNLLGFLKAREEAAFSDIRRNGSELSFRLKSSIPHQAKLTVMIPFRYQDSGIARIKVNGQILPFESRKMKGKQYAFVTVKTASNYSFNVAYDRQVN